MVKSLLTGLSAFWLGLERVLDRLDRLWIGVIAAAAATGILVWLFS
jgi:hypothetical protein